MEKVVVVKFKNNCKLYYFDAGNLKPVKGRGVIVETARGLEYGKVVESEREVEESAIVRPLKKLVRLATERDEETLKRNEERRKDALKTCKERIAAHGLEMKLIDCEFTFEGNKVIFTFTAEGRVDFRELVRDLASVFKMRIELKQVGIRDETRILGGIAPCGRECCCAGCLPDFKKTSIKMAKNQGLSLNPGKISGLCGRLMCCLAYENDFYAQENKRLPKVGATVSSPEGKGTVVSVNALKGEARLKFERDGGVTFRDFPASELKFQKAEGGAQPEEPDEDEAE